MVNDNGYERFFEETRDASPANLLVRIESLSLFSTYGVNKYESSPFEAGGYKWKVIIYPGEDDYVSVMFSIAETDSLPMGWEVNATFAFFLYNYSMDNYLCFRGRTHRFNAVIPKWGFSKLMSTKSLMDPREGYVVDDGCVFGAEVHVIKTQPLNECFRLVKHTVRRNWKISDFSKLGYVWNPKEFVVGDYKWKVSFYPKGKSSRAKGRYVSVFLTCIDAHYKLAPQQKVKAEIVMFIKSKLNDTSRSSKFYAWFTSSALGWGRDEFVAIDDMSSGGFVVDDCFSLGVQISTQAFVRDAPKI